MDLSSIIPDILPHIVTIGPISIFQSLIAWLLGTSIFVVMILLYAQAKKNNSYNKIVQGVGVVM